MANRMDIRSAVVAALVAIVWGLCFVLIQVSLPDPAPLLLAGARALIGGAGRPTLDPRAGLPPLAVVLVLSLANATLAFGAMYLPASRADAAVASVLASGQLLVLTAAGWLWFAERGSDLERGRAGHALGGVVVVAAANSGATTPKASDWRCWPPRGRLGAPFSCGGCGTASTCSLRPRCSSCSAGRSWSPSVPSASLRACGP